MAVLRKLITDDELDIRYSLGPKQSLSCMKSTFYDHSNIDEHIWCYFALVVIRISK